MARRTHIGSIRDKLRAAVAERPPIAPDVSTFAEFLVRQARVKVGSGYLPYTTIGRPALALATQWVDEIIGSGRQDCRIKIKGGAQWGKTVWALNLYGYLLGSQSLGVGYYLPDKDLVDGIVDTKFRPDVVDQIPWLAQMLSVGRTLNKSGKAVNRKGAIMATDGERVALGYFLGCNRVPTTYTHDVQIVDERDDINEINERFLDGRLTASDLRLRIDIGTARYDKAGMDAEFEDSTQHCAHLHCPGCDSSISPEDEWPGICRLQAGEVPASSDPRLTLTGDFKASEEGATLHTHKPGNAYYFACPRCGGQLDRSAVEFSPRRPEMAALGKYGVEVSQLSTPAIGLNQIVAAWVSAVSDPDKMRAFRCDRWARPKSSTQGLDTGIMDRSRRDYALSIVPSGRPRFGGVDTGDRFWFVAREIESEGDKSFAWAEQISPTIAQSRIPQLYKACGLSCLMIDIGNERLVARNIVMIINDILDSPPLRPGAEAGRINFGNGLMWDGERKQWRGLRAAAVEFSGRPGCGIIHELRRTQEDRAYPVIRANRDESIQRVIDEFLTYDDGLVAVVDGAIRTEPVMHMPTDAPGCNAAVPILQQHFISGSRKAPGKDGKSLSFIDRVENHYLLANAYSALAEQVADAATRNTVAPAAQSVGRFSSRGYSSGTRSRGSFL